MAVRALAVPVLPDSRRALLFHVIERAFARRSQQAEASRRSRAQTARGSEYPYRKCRCQKHLRRRISFCIVESALAAESDINSKAVSTLRVADKRAGLRAVICVENSLLLFFYALFEHGGSFAFTDSLRCFFCHHHLLDIERSVDERLTYCYLFGRAPVAEAPAALFLAADETAGASRVEIIKISKDLRQITAKGLPCRRIFYTSHTARPLSRRPSLGVRRRP